MELISSSWQCLTEFELNCEASEAGGDDAFFPTQPELLHHLAGHPGMKLGGKSIKLILKSYLLKLHTCIGTVM